jgi:hypothetical protein
MEESNNLRNTDTNDRADARSLLSMEASNDLRNTNTNDRAEARSQLSMEESNDLTNTNTNNRADARSHLSSEANDVLQRRNTEDRGNQRSSASDAVIRNNNFINCNAHSISRSAASTANQFVLNNTIEACFKLCLPGNHEPSNPPVTGELMKAFESDVRLARINFHFNAGDPSARFFPSDGSATVDQQNKMADLLNEKIISPLMKEKF